MSPPPHTPSLSFPAGAQTNLLRPFGGVNVRWTFTTTPASPPASGGGLGWGLIPSALVIGANEPHHVIGLLPKLKHTVGNHHPRLRAARPHVRGRFEARRVVQRSRAQEND